MYFSPLFHSFICKNSFLYCARPGAVSLALLCCRSLSFSQKLGFHHMQPLGNLWEKVSTSSPFVYKMKRLYNLVSCFFFLLLICSPIYFRCTYDGTLKDLLVYFRPKQPKKMFYQKLAIPIHELENKKQIKCTYLSTDQVRLQLIFYLKVT